MGYKAGIFDSWDQGCTQLYSLMLSSIRSCSSLGFSLVVISIDVMVEDRVREESIDMQQDEEVHKFDKLLDDAKREVYPGCKYYTLLKVHH